MYPTLGNLPLAHRRLHRNLPVVVHVPKSDAPEEIKETITYRRARRQLLLLHLRIADLLRPLGMVQDACGAAVVVPVAGRQRVLHPSICAVMADNELLAHKKKTTARPCHDYMEHHGHRRRSRR